ncbi:hypothetical protein EDB84DRAFT_1567173 [Lactarius hengduanensis]|nr:hypothetical protein EDB84DRAFT_1567173 [Lactarius hengduanensis]
MPIEKAKQDAESSKEPYWLDDESEDEDYGSDLESNGSCTSADWDGESIPCDELRLLAADLVSEDEEGGATGEARHDIGLTDEQVSMLQKHVAEFRAADAVARSIMIQDLVGRIETSWQQDADFDREDVETLVRRYLHNKRCRERKKFNFHHRKWTYYDILVDRHREELDKMAIKMSKSRAGSAAYLGFYKKALKLIWEEQKPPPRQQQWMFAKHGVSTIQDFSEMMYCQYGVRVAILAGYCDNDGEPSIMFHDCNDDLDGTSFKARYKGWSKDPMVEEFSRWTAESFGARPADSGEDNRKRDATRKVKLPTDEKGYPALPSWEAIDREGLKYKKMVIGSFMSEMYWIAVGGGKGRVPWAKLQEAQDNFIAAKYLPNGITLTQYHHIRLEDANSLLKHWTQRQAAGEVPFRFKKMDKACRHGSARAGPINQAEGDVHGGQAHKETQGDGEGLTEEGPDGQSQGDGAGSPNSSTNGQQPREELPTQEDRGSPTNPSLPLPLPRPRPRILTKRRPQTGSSMVGPVQKHPPNDQATRPSKRQKHRSGDAPPETRRSARETWPTERAKQIK